MKLEIRYPDKPSHEVELGGALVVLGRDPSCDLVLNDERCSRRHAVLEQTPTGLQIRDAGSANGVFVNGKKSERAILTAGDLLRLGDVILKVLRDDSPGTVVATEGEIAGLGTPPSAPAAPSGPSKLGTAPPVDPASQSGALRARRPPSGALTPAAGVPRAGRPAPDPARASSGAPLPAAAAARPASVGAVTAAGGGPAGRPLTVTLLAGLWLASIFVFAGQAAVGVAMGLRGAEAAAFVSVSVLLALVAAVMAWALFGLKPWARLAQAGIAALGLLVCPFTLASATTLIYVMRPGTKAAFDTPARATADPAEMTFALTLIGTVLLGAALCAAGFLAYRFWR